ncbi:MAG: hypothetical protein M1820_006418 [Bogoriella megaspora]|nr:MAG: hypothetical protein M1820_006418 [Bogoriella megaspora]
MPRLTPVECAERAVDLAQVAYDAGTFAIGGILLDKTGNVLKEIHNNVVREGKISDPTAHAERQLISWYYEQIHRGVSLPPPSELRIVTSLDPCLMCAGAILECGINVIVVAYDDIGGVNWARDGQFVAVPPTIWSAAFKQIAYFGLDDGTRWYAGVCSSMFENALIPASIVQRSFELARTSLDNVRKIVHPDRATDVNGTPVPADPTAIRALLKYYDGAFCFEADIGQPKHRALLLDKMVEVAKDSEANGGYFDSAALVDPRSNVLLILGSAPLPSSKIDTPLMSLARTYATCRRNSLQDSLPHPSQCKVVLLYGPGPDALGMMDMGAFGLTLGRSENPQELFYFRKRQSEAQLRRMVENMPPLFRDDMKITPKWLGA